METALLALCCCALSLVLALFVSISPISDKAKIRFMYVGAALSLIAVPMMSHYILSCNNKAFLIGQEVCFIIYKRHMCQTIQFLVLFLCVLLSFPSHLAALRRIILAVKSLGKEHFTTDLTLAFDFKSYCWHVFYF